MPRVYKITREQYEARAPRKRRSSVRRSWIDRTPPILPTPRDRRGITRIDHPSQRTHGWFARVYPGGKREIRRFFADLKYGGTEAALQAAEAWRDTTRATINR